ncbi:ABC transporter permease [bacterium]|nr:ABC transporter permease [bacterium]
MIHTRSMTFVSIATITIALILLGLLALTTLFAHTFLDSVMKSEEINVFISDEMADADMLALETTIASMSEVESTRILTKEDAARELKRIFKEDLLTGLDSNPLPRSIIVTMASGYRMSGDLERVATRIRKIGEVESVEYGQEWMAKMDIFFIAFLLAETVLFTIIGCACLFIISNTISLTILARRDTIEIMQLVGATNRFIRRPFYYEGLIQGIISGIAAFLLLYGSYLWIRHYIPNLDVYFYMFRIRGISVLSHRLVLGCIIPVGGFMGLLGSMIAVRRAI